MDRDDARDMQDMLMEDIVDVNDPNIDWDTYSQSRSRYYEDDYDDEYYFEPEPKNKFELFAEEQIDIKSRFKNFIIKEVNNESDILELLQMVRGQMISHKQLFDYSSKESEEIMSHIEIENKAGFLLKYDFFNKAQLESDGYEILNEDAVDKIIESRKILIKTLSEKFNPVYKEEFYNRIMDKGYSYYWKIKQLCKTIHDLEETCKEFYMDDQDKLMD